MEESLRFAPALPIGHESGSCHECSRRKARSQSHVSGQMNAPHSAREDMHAEEKQRQLPNRNWHLLTATCVDLGTYTAIHSLRGWCEQQWSQVHGQTKLRTEGNCPPRHARIQARRAQSRQRTTRQGE